MTFLVEGGFQEGTPAKDETCQNHRLTAYLGTTIQTGSTMRKKSSSQPPAQSCDDSAKCNLDQYGGSQHDGWYG